MARLDGWLEIAGLRCEGRHGAYAGEKRRRRTFLVDVALRADLRRAAARDALTSTIDFAAIAATARDVVGGPARTLLERVAADIAQSLLDRFRLAREVRVRVTKPSPQGLGANAEAATITLSRSVGRRRATPTPSGSLARRRGRRARG